MENCPLGRRFGNHGCRILCYRLSFKKPGYEFLMVWVWHQCSWSGHLAHLDRFAPIQTTSIIILYMEILAPGLPAGKTFYSLEHLAHQGNRGLAGRLSCPPVGRLLDRSPCKKQNSSQNFSNWFQQLPGEKRGSTQRFARQEMIASHHRVCITVTTVRRVWCRINTNLDVKHFWPCGGGHSLLGFKENVLLRQRLGL